MKPSSFSIRSPIVTFQCQAIATETTNQTKKRPQKTALVVTHTLRIVFRPCDVPGCPRCLPAALLPAPERIVLAATESQQGALAMERLDLARAGHHFQEALRGNDSTAAQTAHLSLGSSILMESQAD